MIRRGLFIVLGAAGALSCGDDAASTTGGGSGSTAQTTSTGTGGAGGAGGAGGDPGAPTVRLPKTSITPAELGLLVNDQDPQSVELGAYYAAQRGIPAENVVTVSFPATGGDNLPAAELMTLKAQIDAATPDAVQAFAVTWTYPTRVDCMSLTSALAFGFDLAYCNTTGMGCGPTEPSPYFDSDSVAPFTDHGIRPAMVLAGATVDSAKALVDRGVAADDTFPTGDGFFVRTTDVARSVRWQSFTDTVDLFAHPTGLALTYLDNSAGGGLDYIEDETEVLFYFTGLTAVPAIDTLGYRPGAVADHLTSFGGAIPAGSQMSVLAWLEAGATASFGTVREPCNYTQKFPNTEVLVPQYFRGATVIEAYWKSVRWPGEGLFVGEPLARPWGASTTEFDEATRTLTITTTLLDPSKSYELRAADSEDGPYTPVVSVFATVHERATITLADATARFYELAVMP